MHRSEVVQKLPGKASESGHAAVRAASIQDTGRSLVDAVPWSRTAEPTDTPSEATHQRPAGARLLALLLPALPVA